LAKRKKSKSKNRPASGRPLEEDARLPEAESEAATDTAQHKRWLYAGGAVIVILVGVIVLVTHGSHDSAPSASGSKWLDQATPPAVDRSMLSKEPSSQGPIPGLSKNQIAAPANVKLLRDRLKIGGEGPEMVMVAAGSFQMGDMQGRDKAAMPVHTVNIPKPFAIGRYEVTFEDYDKFAQATKRELPNDGGGGRGRQPVINFTWQEAVEYGNWLTGQTGNRYRLPTEAEWEYAARGGTETNFWWGNEMKSGMANCAGCGSRWDEKVTAPVGSFHPNSFGLYDTAGNVWEWVEDCDHENYNGAPADGSAWKKDGGGNCYLRVFRGGAWNYGVKGLRSSFRGRGDPGTRSATIGFRLVREIE
jgi:formylglycine-generating enzyme required for sulfatase activity